MANLNALFWNLHGSLRTATGGKLKEFRICTFLWNLYISMVGIRQEWRNEIFEREWPLGVPRFRLDELVVVLNHCESDSGYSPVVMSFMIPWSYHV